MTDMISQYRGQVALAANYNQLLVSSVLLTLQTGPRNAKE